MSEVTAGRDDEPVLEWCELRPGQSVEARQGAVVLHRGVVEDVATAFGVVWVRAATSGERKMLSRDDVVLHLR